MKLNDILINEGPKAKSFAHRQNLAFDVQLKIVRDFLRANRDPQVASIYQHAVNNRQFAPDDIGFLSQKFTELGYDQRIIDKLRA